MEPRQLRYFTTIAELGSFAAASRSLYITQPALTRQIQNLEESLSVALFERHSRGVQLTPAGRQFYNDAQHILKQMEQAKVAAIKADRGERGSLKVGVTPQHLWLNEVQQYLASFHKRNPEINLHISTLNSAQQLMALREGRLDIGFLFSCPEEDPDLINRFLYKERMLLATPNGSLLAIDPPETLTDLLTSDFIWAEESPSYHLYKLVEDELKRLNFVPEVIHHANNYNAMLSLVSAGFGYTFAPAVAKYLNTYNVTFHSIPELSITFDLELVWNRHNKNPTLAKMIQNYHPQMTRLR